MTLYTLLTCHLIVLDIILLFFDIINVNVSSYGNHLPSPHDVPIKQTVDLVCPPSPTNSILNQSSEYCETCCVTADYPVLALVVSHSQ